MHTELFEKMAQSIIEGDSEAAESLAQEAIALGIERSARETPGTRQA